MVDEMWNMPSYKNKLDGGILTHAVNKILITKKKKNNDTETVKIGNTHVISSIFFFYWKYASKNGNCF